MRVLVADDDPILRTFLADAVERLGHEVETFEDGQQLWEAFEKNPTKLVITDWMMPRLSGLDVCRKVRADPALRTHLIVVSSLSPSEHTVEAFRAGADDFVGKPLDPVILEGRIKVAVRGMLAHAEESMRQCLDICQTSLGPEHAGLLQAIDALVNVSREQRAYVRCRAFLRREIAIAEKSFGPTAPRTLKLRSDLDEIAGLEDEL